MVNIRVIEKQKSLGSGEVGEIDTRAPFQSVKAAVSLFGEVAVSKEKRTVVRVKSKVSSENVLEKETQFLLAQKEYEKYKQKLESAETVKSRAASELERAKRTLEELTSKLLTASKSKQFAIENAEEVKRKTKDLEIQKSAKQLGDVAERQELDLAREQYKITANELDAVKQKLNEVRQDFDAALEAKLVSFQHAAEAHRAANVNTGKVQELSKEIKAMCESMEQLKVTSAKAKEYQDKILADKDACIKAYKCAMNEVQNNLDSLKREHDPELTRNLEIKLSETVAEIEALQEEMKRAHDVEMDAVKVVTTELNEATKKLKLVAEEENTLRNTVTSLKLEMENVRNEKAEWQAKEAEMKAIAEEKQRAKLTIQKEAEEMKYKAEKLRNESEISRKMYDEADRKLEQALRDAEEAKEAAKQAREHLSTLSQEKNTQSEESNNKMINLSLEEFETLNKKLEDSQNRAESKETEALAEVALSNARKLESEKKLEANLKAIEEIKEATDMALKSAEMAKAAQAAVENELRRWRDTAPDDMED
ncbi:hypothetical protein K2173_011045 [Erythroxylum novogranatense]|uniref:Uncharacterized protein n=1 Tax=Erythroxylum novogranatense TaxID=1862640 RepID=A0AAV8T1D5_9ROSI|nr:hypothetical protein K2173_011045 [Erythroxylum novogranatense]